MKNIHLRSLLLGIVLGAVAALVLDAMFGQDVRKNVAGATEEIGEGVQKVGRKIEETSDKIK